MSPAVLTINGGSSSIKFALYEARAQRRLFSGKVERLGLSGTKLTARDADGKPLAPCKIKSSDASAAVGALWPWLELQPGFAAVAGVGHRIVHGMAHREPERVTPRLLADLHRTVPYDLEHLPRGIELIEMFRQRHPKIPQVACFDTVFHATMPRVAQLLALPRRYFDKGVRRYGFHGISYAYLMEELARLGDPAAKRGRVILAHLGNGASLAAVRDGKGIDTSMGFTPAAGLVMSTRAGDLDPGLMSFLARRERMTPDAFTIMVNKKSGLLGLSETSSDMRDLLAREARDERAAEAVAVFCYQLKKWIGAFAAALGGVDTLVFAGGIGENCPPIRQRACAGLEFLGIKLDQKRNQRNAALISGSGPVRVRIIHTDEEQMIARTVTRLLHL